MKLMNLFEGLLNEATPTEIYNKFYQNIPYEEFVQVVGADPQTKFNGEELARIGKYAKVLINMYRAKNLKLEDLPKAKEYLGHVYKRNIALTPDKVKVLGDLYNIVKPYIAQESSSLQDIIKTLDNDDYNTVHNGENWVIYTPKTEKGSAYLGVGTEWCTAWGKHSLNKAHRDRQCQFNTYNRQGPLYILINKGDEKNKYQFHFETKQMMNPADKQIDVNKFLSDNEEVKRFFYPSLYKETSDEVKMGELTRATYIGHDESAKILKMLVDGQMERGEVASPIVAALVQEDEDALTELFQKEEHSYVDEVSIRNGTLEVTLRELESNVEEIYTTTSYYEMDARNAYESIIDDYDGYDDIKDEIRVLFKAYYTENESHLRSLLGVASYTQFESEFFEDLVDDRDMVKEYKENVANNNADNLRDACNTKVTEIQAVISIDKNYRYSTVSMPVSKVVMFMLNKRIMEVDDFDEFISQYASFCDIGDYEHIYDYERITPTLENCSGFVSELDTYFENLAEEFESDSSCATYRKVFADTYKKFFQEGHTFENESVRVNIRNLQVNCEKGTIEIEYVNKVTDRKYNGEVKVGNLVKYLTNYDLFESYFTIKKLIK